jgi:glycosyltransferase involved in cell wall biosynthesis
MKHDSPIRVAWEGTQLVHHSLALVNRELCLRLARRPGFELSLVPYEPDRIGVDEDPRFRLLKDLERRPLDGVDVHVRHQWPLNLHPPKQGRWVIVQPWEFGSIPRSWHEAMKFGADEIWVPGTFNKACYVESGIPEEKVHVVPNGVHEAILTEPSPFPLRTRKAFKFLFVGGTIPRKGIDILLDAYATTFSAKDDVCLVVKDFGAASFYQGQTFGAMIRELQSRTGAPEIEYITEELSFTQLRDLYHACDCLVHPYRGEGFGLPIAEAMACGLPVIVPDRGGASDFCTPETAVLVRSERRNLPAGALGELETVASPWWLEVDRKELRERMRAAYEDPTALRPIAEAGRTRVRDAFTWDRAAELAAARIEALAGREGVPLRDDPAALHALRLREGVEAWGRGERHRAIGHFLLAGRIEWTADVLFNTAAALMETGDPHAALPYLERLARMIGEPTDPEGAHAAIEALSTLAACQLGIGRVTEARATLRRVLALDPAHAHARSLLATLDDRAATTRPAPRNGAPRLRWVGTVFNATGYADEARTYLFGLEDLGWRIRLDPVDPVEHTGVLTDPEFARLQAMVRNRGEVPDIDIHHIQGHADIAPAARIAVLRTMFETDRIPIPWVHRCNRYTEVWVPTEFNRETFARSGVVPEKIRVVPEGIDLDRFDPTRYRPLPIPGSRAFRFLSVFDWTPRKGWDVLLRSYFEEFGPGDDVTLVLKVTNYHKGLPPADFVRKFLEENGYRHPPHYIVLDRHLSSEEMISLYVASDAFVLPTRGEGWGRPYMEAMALGIPTIGTRWSGNLAFMNDENSFLIDIEGLEPSDTQGSELFRGHLWASPSVESTRAQMRRVYEDRPEAARRADRARRDIAERFGRDVIARQVDAEIRRLLDR